MSARLRQRYPDEMTVVLQHQFWDLNVTDAAFEVGLSFSGIPERLYVPFNSIKGFFDPSVQFGLQFEPVRDGETATDETDDDATGPQSTAINSSNVVQSLPLRTGGLRLAETDRTEAAQSGGHDVISQSDLPADATAPERPATGRPTLKAVPTSADPADMPNGATVVSIDSFRKKP